MPTVIDPANQPIVDGLNHFIATLGAMPLLSSEKKQLAEVQKGVALLTTKLTQHAVDADTCAKTLQLLGMLGARDYAGANVVNTALANTGAFNPCFLRQLRQLHPLTYPSQSGRSIRTGSRESSSLCSWWRRRCRGVG